MQVCSSISFSLILFSALSLPLPPSLHANILVGTKKEEEKMVENFKKLFTAFDPAATE